jgi:2-polyprenyl-6-methoxyphenol hydroxylase-like FAD-dependent oxidoreductase
MPDLGGGLDHGLAIRRSDLYAVLVDAVQGEPRIRTRLGWRAVSVHPEGEVVVQHGNAIQTMTSALVVGADGVSSVVRSAIGFTARVSSGASYIRALVPGAAEAKLEEYWTPLGAFGYAPIGKDVIYFYAAAHRPEVAEPLSRRDLPTVAAVWGATVPAAGELLEQVADFDDLLLNTVRRVDCACWWAGRVVLLGDAAHAMAPNLGQGANSAMVDAAVLSAELSTAATTTEALRRYDRRRRPAARRIQDTAAMLERWCGLRDRRQIWLRDTAARLVGGVPFVMSTGLRRSLVPDVRAVRGSG